jgi:hypothetical protein
MRANLIAPNLVALAVALASSGANTQAVISRSVTVEPVETTVTQTLAYLGGHAYLVDPATGTIVEDVTE